MEVSARQERVEQLFIRAVTGGSIIERDYLLSYTISDFYNERSLFIEEVEKKAKAIEEAKEKSKYK